MNCIISKSKKLLLTVTLLILCTNGYSQRLNFAAIAQVVNTDSLEKNLSPNQPQTYIKQLLILEYSWYRTNNPKLGSKLSDLTKLAKTQKRTDVLPICDLWNGYIFIKQRQHSQAFIFLNNALRGFESQRDTVGLIQTYVRLSNLNLTQTKEGQQNIKAGIEYATEAVKLAEKLGNKTYLIYSLANLNIGYTYSGDKKELERKTAERQLELIGNDPTLQEYSLSPETTLALLQEREGNYEEAYRIIAPSKKNGKAKKYLPRFYYNAFVLNLVGYCIKLKKYDEAISNLDEVLADTKDKEFWLLREDAFNRYKEVYKAQNNYYKALIYADSSTTLRNEILKTENINKLNELEVTYKTKELKNQNIALNKENELIKSRNNAIIISVIGAAILITLLLTVLYYLNQSRKKAQLQAEEIKKLSQIRDQYIRIIAHDLRSPIYAMQGMYDMVNDAIKTKHFDDLQRISHYIDETGIKTKHLLDNLMNWGMTQQDEVSYVPQKLNVLENLYEVISIYASLKVIKDFNITVNCQSKYNVYADKQGFQLILRNLVDNAIKNLPSSNGIIDISVSADEENNVSIEIQDNGKGIPEEKLATINSVFSKPHSVVMGKNGLGLGITLIGKFVKSNHGSITAQSVVNSGSKFTLWLPISS